MNKSYWYSQSEPLLSARMEFTIRNCAGMAGCGPNALPTRPPEELLAMADAIGIDRKWLQCPGEPKEHFDVSKGNRAKAVALGAKEIGRKEVGNILASRRNKKIDRP